VALIKRTTSEEKEARRLAKETERAAREAEKAREVESKAKEKLRSQFFASPAGQARIAFENGGQVFQYALDVYTTQTFHIPMVGAYSAPKSTSDPSEILNSVCNEGWELVNGSFVFLETGSESRDKFLASGQHIAVSGTILGYYLFKRCEANRRATIDPWDVAEAVDEVADSVTEP
jgi:hypothetical protein